MYLKKSRSQNGRIYLSICESYRKDGKSRTRTIEKCGYLDELQAAMDDPIAYYQKRAADLTRAKAESGPTPPATQAGELISKSEPYCVMLGTLPLSRVYHQLEIDRFWRMRRASHKLPYDLNAVFRMLTYGRVIHPAPMMKSWSKRALMPDRCDFTREQLCDAVSYLARYENLYRTWIANHCRNVWEHDGKSLYCGITNYYFEIEDRDANAGGRRRPKQNPIVQTALLLDQYSEPVDYEVFTGAVENPLTLLPVIQKLKGRHHGKRFIVVMDKGLSVEENLTDIVAAGDGFIFNQSIRRAAESKQEWIFDDDGYRDDEKLGMRVKSRMVERKVVVTGPDGSAREKVMPVREIAFWSRRLAIHAKEGRARILEKNQGVFGRARRSRPVGTVESSAANVRHVSWQLDWKRIEAEERTDGYNCIVTSEVDTDPTVILEQFIGLWQTESTFRVVKSAYNDYPVPVPREDKIRAHFMVCYTALVILRILQKLTGNKYSIGQISSELACVQGYAEDANWFLFSHRTDLLDDVGRATGVDMTRRRLTRAQIKQMLAETKRTAPYATFHTWSKPSNRSILIFDISAVDELDLRDSMF